MCGAVLAPVLQRRCVIQPRRASPFLFEVGSYRNVEELASASTQDDTAVESSGITLLRAVSVCCGRERWARLHSQ